jgi:hypothetical protein
MTKDDFLSLSLHDKAAILKDMGCYIENMMWYRYDLRLYSLHTFFVEVYFFEDSNSIAKIEVVEGDGLNKYLIRIGLENLVV